MDFSEEISKGLAKLQVFASHPLGGMTKQEQERKYMDLKSTYNKIAEDWSKDHDEDTWWIKGTDEFLTLLPKKASILDVGCGAGLKSRYIAAQGFKVTGIDFSEKMIDIAREKSPGVDFEVFDVYELDKYPKTFDAIFAQAVLLHVPKERVFEVLTKMKARLNPNGLLYVAVKGIKSDGIEEKVIKEEDYGYTYERFFTFFSRLEMRELFDKLGMEVLWQDGYDDSDQVNWIQIVGRKK